MSATRANTVVIFNHQVRSLKYVVLPESAGDSRGAMQTDSRARRNQRTQFLAFYSFALQAVFMFFLSKP